MNVEPIDAGQQLQQIVAGDLPAAERADTRGTGALRLTRMLDIGAVAALTLTTLGLAVTYLRPEGADPALAFSLDTLRAAIVMLLAARMLQIGAVIAADETDQPRRRRDEVSALAYEDWVRTSGSLSITVPPALPKPTHALSAQHKESVRHRRIADTQPQSQPTAAPMGTTRRGKLASSSGTYVERRRVPRLPN